MNELKTDHLAKEEDPPIFGSWTNVYIWLIVVNLICVILFYLFMIYYT